MTNNNKTQEKINALLTFLNNRGEETTAQDIENINDKSFYIEDQEYLVLTDEEADEEAREQIINDLWAFETGFILNHSNIDYNNGTYEAIKTMQRQLCEDSQPIIEAIINDIDEFCEDAISSDGRGHFLAWYDGDENEQDGFYIYKR